MTVPVIKVKVFQRAVIKAKADIRYPARLLEGPGIDIAVANGAATVGLDYTGFAELVTFTAANELVAVYDRVNKVWNVVSLASLVAASQTQQIITVAGDVAVANSDGLIALNKAVGAPTTVTLPASSVKIGPVKVADWKGDAGTNNITIALTGADKLNGNLTSWTIGADAASLVFTPLKDGSGYAV